MNFLLNNWRKYWYIRENYCLLFFQLFLVREKIFILKHYWGD